MQTQFPFRLFDKVANETWLVRRQAVESNAHRLLSSVHQLAQQLDKQLGV